jgi:hypothetical protein
MPNIECSVWNNGREAWGLKVLGGIETRKRYFRREESPVSLELDGQPCLFNIDKKSFWTGTCVELIGVKLRDWIVKNGLKSGDRVILHVLEPYKVFKPTKT